MGVSVLVYNDLYLWGSERYINDLLYVCHDFIKGYECDYGNFPPSDEDVNGRLIVICSPSVEENEKKLRVLRKEYGKDYIFSEEIFEVLDKNYKEFLFQSREVAVWGCGPRAIEFGNNEYVDVYIDKNKELEGTEFNGKKVIHPDSINDWSKYFIFVSVFFEIEVKDYLEKCGLIEGEDFGGYEMMRLIKYFPSKLLKQTIESKPISDFRCNQMIKKVDVDIDGYFIMCCGGYIDVVAGNIKTKNSIKSIWDSYVARVLKLSIVNNTYVFCTNNCDSYYSNKKKLIEDDYDSLGDYTNDGGIVPQKACIGIDMSCNLRCPSCRSNYYNVDKKRKEQLYRMADKITNEWLPNAQEVVIAGQGEVFYSDVYKKLLSSKMDNDITIVLKSNGLLFNEKNFNIVKRNYKKIKLHVSIDAATKEVYEDVRRGSRWEILCRNMEYASELRRKDELEEFAIFFVVQQRNINDMRKFVELGKKWNCDRVYFGRVLNYGTYSEDEYRNNISVFDENTQHLKGKYITVFDDPIFEDSIVGGIKTFKCG